MENDCFLEAKNNVIELKGNIHFNNVFSLWQKGAVFIHKIKDIKVDLRGLQGCDSSGLALLTAWVRAAKIQKSNIVFIHVPSFMQDIVRVYGLDSILPILWEN